MKKYIICAIITVVTAISAVTAQAAEGVISDGVSYVPLRGVFENLGFKVEVRGTSWINISDDDIRIDIPISLSAGTKPFFLMTTKDNKSQRYNCGKLIKIEGSNYIPLRDIGEGIGAEISWNAEEKIAHISYNGKDSYVHCRPYAAPAAQVEIKTQQPEVKTSQATYPNPQIPALENCVGLVNPRERHVQGKNFAIEYSYYVTYEQVLNEIVKNYEPQLSKIGFTKNTDAKQSYTYVETWQGPFGIDKYNGAVMTYTNKSGSVLKISIRDSSRSVSVLYYG